MSCGKFRVITPVEELAVILLVVPVILNTPPLLNVFVPVSKDIPEPIVASNWIPVLPLVKIPAPRPEFLIPANTTLLLVAMSCGKFRVITPVEELAVILLAVPVILAT